MKPGYINQRPFDGITQALLYCLNVIDNLLPLAAIYGVLVQTLRISAFLAWGNWPSSFFQFGWAFFQVICHSMVIARWREGFRALLLRYGEGVSVGAFRGIIQSIWEALRNQFGQLKKTENARWIYLSPRREDEEKYARGLSLIFLILLACCRFFPCYGFDIIFLASAISLIFSFYQHNVHPRTTPVVRHLTFPASTYRILLFVSILSCILAGALWFIFLRHPPEYNKTPSECPLGDSSVELMEFLNDVAYSPSLTDLNALIQKCLDGATIDTFDQNPNNSSFYFLVKWKNENIVVFRGTCNAANWRYDFEKIVFGHLLHISDIIMRTWFPLWFSPCCDCSDGFASNNPKLKVETKLTITGHSMGAEHAYCFWRNGHQNSLAYLFASPYVEIYFNSSQLIQNVKFVGSICDPVTFPRTKWWQESECSTNSHAIRGMHSIKKGDTSEWAHHYLLRYYWTYGPEIITFVSLFIRFARPDDVPVLVTFL